MTAQLKLRPEEVAPLRTHYQNVAFDALGLLWGYKYLIAGFALAGVLTALAAMVLLPPRFTAEAILHVNFSREEPNSPVRVQRIASLEASAIVESTLRVLRSRPLASAVVSQLKLDEDPDFSRPSRSRRILNDVRQALGLSIVTPTAHDTATERVMGALRINMVPRSYVISIAMDSGDPVRAARIVNAVLLEYIRGHQVQQLSEILKGVDRELTELSAIYGKQHPRIIDSTEKQNELQKRIVALNATTSLSDEAIQMFGEFQPAEAVLIPSGPNTLVITILILAAFMTACALIILGREMLKSRRAQAYQQKVILQMADAEHPVFQKKP